MLVVAPEGRRFLPVRAQGQVSPPPGGESPGLSFGRKVQPRSAGAHAAFSTAESTADHRGRPIYRCRDRCVQVVVPLLDEELARRDQLDPDAALLIQAATRAAHVAQSDGDTRNPWFEAVQRGIDVALDMLARGFIHAEAVLAGGSGAGAADGLGERVIVASNSVFKPAGVVELALIEVGR